MESAHLLLDGCLGYYGSVGTYGAVQRIFLVGLAALPLCLFIDAPFGRWAPRRKRWTLPGNISWLLMELVSPLALLNAAATPLTNTSSTAGHPILLLHPRQLFATLTTLPYARLLLLGAFVIHYSNRSIISTLRNWHGRARMAFFVPLLAALFNLANGTLMGRWLAGGLAIAEAGKLGSKAGEWGLKDGWGSAGLFVLGMSLWLGGFITNIACDEVLLRLKKEKPDMPRTASPRERYSIPYGGPFGLYDLVSHPSYCAEWVEWTGFLLATKSLAPSPFPFLALTSRNSPTALLSTVFRRNGASLLRGVPEVLRPLQAWYLQPPALFLANEVAAMLPRAVSGHRWYKQTFGRDWPKERKVVIPYVY